MTHRGPFQPLRFCDSEKTEYSPLPVEVSKTVGQIQKHQPGTVSYDYQKLHPESIYVEPTGKISTSLLFTWQLSSCWNTGYLGCFFKAFLVWQKNVSSPSAKKKKKTNTTQPPHFLDWLKIWNNSSIQRSANQLSDSEGKKSCQVLDDFTATRFLCNNILVLFARTSSFPDCPRHRSDTTWIYNPGMCSNDTLALFQLAISLRQRLKVQLKRFPLRHAVVSCNWDIPLGHELVLWFTSLYSKFVPGCNL